MSRNYQQSDAFRRDEETDPAKLTRDDRARAKATNATSPRVRSRDGAMLGTATGEEDHDGNIDCGVDDCRSISIEVEWPDGTQTWVCPSGLRPDDDGIQRIQ